MEFVGGDGAGLGRGLVERTASGGGPYIWTRESQNPHPERRRVRHPAESGGAVWVFGWA
jgi:hypothetical protein